MATPKKRRRFRRSRIYAPIDISFFELLGAFTAILTILTFASTININLNFGGYSVFWLIAFAVVSVAAFFYVAYNSNNKGWYAVPIALLLVFAAMGGYGIYVIRSPAPIDISIKDPSDNSSAGYVVSVSGTWQNVPADQHLWLMLYSVNASRYYPQPGPIKLLKTEGDNLKGVWAGFVLCGQPTSGIGEKFIIFPVITNSTTGNLLYNYTQGTIGNFSGMTDLPPGAEPHGSVNVTRTT